MPRNTYPCRHKILSRDRRVCIIDGKMPPRGRRVSHFSRRGSVMRAVLALLWTVTVCGLGGAASAWWTPAHAAAAAQTTTGTIDSVGTGVLTLTSTAGARVQVMTTAETFVLDRLSARLEDIKVGDFIGVAARKEAGGALTAVSINIFAPALRGRIREGQFPMESGDIMTNAVVTQYVSRVAGRTVSLAITGGVATITVPPGAEIHRLVLIAPSDLRAGMRVTVRGSANPDGSMTASSVTVEGPVR